MSEHATARTLRQCVLLLCGFVTLVTPVELLLVNHTQKPTQWIPFVMLVVNLAFLSVMFFKPKSATLLAYRWFALLMLLSALVGVFYHLRGNFEQVQEVAPELSGLALLLEVLRGANPALAPGLFVQIAALGLMFTFRHPSLEQGLKINHPRSHTVPIFAQSGSQLQEPMTDIQTLPEQERA
jgi:uncharacterized membrane protein HdeD (DUF308 family)